MPRADWPDRGAGAYVKDGIDYCCKGCIEVPGVHLQTRSTFAGKTSANP